MVGGLLEVFSGVLGLFNGIVSHYRKFGFWVHCVRCCLRRLGTRCYGLLFKVPGSIGFWVCKGWHFVVVGVFWVCKLG